MEESNAKKTLQKITEFKRAEEERLTRYLSERNKLGYLSPHGLVVDPSALQIIKEKDARDALAGGFKLARKKLHIAVKDLRNPKFIELADKIKRRGYKLEPYLASTLTLEKIWEFYKDFVATSATTPGELSITNKELEDVLKKVKSIALGRARLKELEQMVRSRRISKNIEIVLAVAMALKVSDIHIEPSKTIGVLRFRIDGVLVKMYQFSREDTKLLLSRLKLVSGMKININDEAQDGSFSVNLNDRTIRIRSSAIPEPHGESFVLRILDPNNVVTDIKSLGLHPNLLETFRREIDKPNGMILTTGPTGSGKTTTLYSFLNEVNSTDIKIITLEDPIEYHLEGIIQTQIEEEYSFASGLRSVLRQDPDVILVGEIRDGEVAEVAINAALTGHLVFSTLHTNDAIGALPRLARLKIKANTFSRALNLVIAQRLVRIICKECSEKQTLSKEELSNLEKIIKEMPEKYMKEALELGFENVLTPTDKSKTCEHCNNGYKGRVGVFEAFSVNEKIQDVMEKGGGAKEIKEAIKGDGFVDMKQDGLIKALKGMTSFKELDRVIEFKI